jgi:glucosyl-dolichyl phosphate glucuronosyltransferase
VHSISIVIATSGRTAALEDTLDSLAKVHCPQHATVELLLVENGSRFEAERLLENFTNFSAIRGRYFFEPQRGKSRALNLALTHASGDVLLFSDDDVRFPTDWIERISRPIVSDRADAVAGGVRIAPHLLRPWMNHTHRACLASTADYLSALDPSEMCGANMAIRRTVFERIGGFDPELGPGVTGGGEESLLSWQIRTAGFRLVGTLDVEVEHHFDAGRLRYQNWIKAAQLRGEARALLAHHWFHKTIRFAPFLRLFITAKLVLRRVCSSSFRPEDEGISPWEMSYLEDIAMYSSYVKERRRNRTYTLHGLRKLVAERELCVA